MGCHLGRSAQTAPGIDPRGQSGTKARLVGGNAGVRLSRRFRRRFGLTHANFVPRAGHGRHPARVFCNQMPRWRRERQTLTLNRDPGAGWICETRRILDEMQKR